MTMRTATIMAMAIITIIDKHDPEKHVLDPIGDGNRFSDKIMLKKS